MNLRAYCLIREQPFYRREAFVTGLQRAGYQVLPSQPLWPARPGDVLVIWNRYGTVEQVADRFEADGGTVLVAENGYLGQGGGTPKFEVHAGVQPQHYYALARHGHNGSGTWLRGDPPAPTVSDERLRRLRLAWAPWRTDGDHILVCPNRHFGMRGFVMPSEWERDVVARLRKITRRPIRVRAHPGTNAPKVPLEQDLQNAWAVVVWASSAGVHALVRGVPVVAEAPWWICKEAAIALADIEQPAPADRRLQAFAKLAWAQWTVEEIASGEPFTHLLH